MKRVCRLTFLTIVCLFMTITPHLSMEVIGPIRPSIENIGGYIYQIIGRTFSSIGENNLANTLIFIACFVLANRYLFHKPKQTGIGEYILSGFFTVWMLLSASLRAEGTILTLYENLFQIIKVAIFSIGYFALFLCALRGLNEGLTIMQNLGNSNTISKETLWSKHPFAFPAVVLSLSWLIQIIVKYPGVLTVDYVVPIQIFKGINSKFTNYPPISVFLNGTLHGIGESINNVNLVYFIIVLMQVSFLICVSSYGLWLLKKNKIHPYICVAVLAFIAISPVYIAWALTLSNDSVYMIACMLLTILLSEFITHFSEFIHKKSRWFLLLSTMTILNFSRGNGLIIIISVFACMAIYLIKNQASKKVRITFLSISLVTFALPLIFNPFFISNSKIVVEPRRDYFSVAYQQTSRVASKHLEEVIENESTVFTEEEWRAMAERYNPQLTDASRAIIVDKFLKNDFDKYISLWWKQSRQYPLDYIDAFAHLNYPLFDLLSTRPVYHHYTDISIHSAGAAFHDTNYFDLEQIRPLLSAQFALNEWYEVFSQIPIIGWMTTMSFCNVVLLMLAYLSYVNGRKIQLLVLLPSLITIFMSAFCPVVYMRYLLPAITCMPLCIAFQTGKK